MVPSPMFSVPCTSRIDDPRLIPFIADVEQCFDELTLGRGTSDAV